VTSLKRLDAVPEPTTRETGEAHGRLREGLHITVYTFERACEHLEWLLVDDRWALSGHFENVNAFMDSMRLDQFRAVAEQRKRIALRIKELQPDVSNRRIAATLGVGAKTIDRDISASNDAAGAGEDGARGASNDANAPSELTGAEAAKRISRFEEAPAKRAERRAEMLARIVEANPPLPTGRRWPVLYADPAWRWETWSRETGLDRGRKRTTRR
jgi:hypothetical protein